MEQLLSYLKNLNLDWQSLSITGGVLLIGSLLVSIVSAFIFGKRSLLADSASSSIGVWCIYAVTAVIYSVGAQLIPYTTDLPFVEISAQKLSFSPVLGQDYTVLCPQLLSMVILSFLMNIVDRTLPKGGNSIGWIFWRCLTIILAMFLHLVAVGLMNKYLPADILTHAPAILLGLLVIMILTGALKILVGVILSTVNPIVAALYTFFFANIVGKQVTKAIFTTCIVSSVFLLLEKLGISALSIMPDALIAYIPFALALLLVWYGTKKLA